jgi:hypothetical protein
VKKPSTVVGSLRRDPQGRSPRARVAIREVRQYPSPSTMERRTRPANAPPRWAAFAETRADDHATARFAPCENVDPLQSLRLRHDHVRRGTQWLAKAPPPLRTRIAHTNRVFVRSEDSHLRGPKKPTVLIQATTRTSECALTTGRALKTHHRWGRVPWRVFQKNIGGGWL